MVTLEETRYNMEIGSTETQKAGKVTHMWPSYTPESTAAPTGIFGDSKTTSRLVIGFGLGIFQFSLTYSFTKTLSFK